MKSWLCQLTFAFALLAAVEVHAQHAVGFVWDRSVNWTVSGSAPTSASYLDSTGSNVWSYSSVVGGDQINDAGTAKWWTLPRQPLVAGSWFGLPVFDVAGTALPYFSSATAQVDNGNDTRAPLLAWRNPAGDGAVVRIGGRIRWNGPTATNTTAADYVLALHRVATNTWEVLDSNVFTPIGDSMAANAVHERNYATGGAQARSPVWLFANDVIVWGFKRHADWTGIGWFNMNDDLLTLTLEGVNVALPAPANLSATAEGYAAQLSWGDAAGGLAPYTVERSVEGGAFAVVAALPAGSTSYRDALLPPGASITYRVTVGSGPLAGSATAGMFTPARSPRSMPDDAYANTRDFGMLWWRDGVRGARVWCVKTSRYALRFEADSLNLTTIFPHGTRADEAATLLEANAVSIPASAPASTLACQFIGNGGTHAVQAFSSDLDDSHLVENGRFYQRRWQKVKTAAGPALNHLQSGLEVCAWPDRVSFVLRLIPTAAVTNGQMTVSLNLADVFGTLTSSGAMQALARSDGSGFAFVKSAGTTALSIDAATATMTVQTEAGAWNAGEERSCGFVVYPLASVAANLASVAQSEAAPLTVTATQTLPVVADAVRAVAYDVDRGFHQITLRHNNPLDDRVELTRVSIANPTASAREVRLNFAKGNPVAQITGVSCILRDDDGNPCGIPVQLSKNWHTAGDERWEGPWFHGLTMLTVPAATTLHFQVLLAGHHYGGVPAASHAQLSLVGWGQHQAWDESAIGAYGEQFTYEPDGDQTACIGADSRPILLLSTAGTTKQWTGNFGGFDFLRFFNTSNQHQRHRRVRTMYQRYSPALTDVTYAAELSNGAMSGTYSASIARSADFSRAFHRFRFEATSNVSFNRLVFFQLAADTYNYACGTAHSQGNAELATPARQWTATFGSNANIAPVTALSGRSPWFYTADGPAPTGFRAANRGYILRRWQARIGGVENVAPHYVERSLSAAAGARENGSAIDLVPPPGVTSLQAGDYIEGEIERVIHPRDAADYYGPDTAFQTALATYANTPDLMLREAIGNDLIVNVTTGALERSYPVQVRAAQGVAAFSITRGVGYVPISITGLGDYRSPVLEENVGGTWTAITQATAGKDFWQCDFNVASATWETTFNVKMDAAFQSNADLLNAPVTRTFRYRQAATPTVLAIADTTTGAGAPVQVTVNLTDADSAAASLSVSATSSNPALIPTGGIAFTGSGASRTLTLTPAAGQTGPVTITVLVHDGSLASARTFTLTVLTLLEQWRQSQFGIFTDTGAAADTADPDGDGFRNADECTLGTNALTFTASPLAATKSGSTVTLTFTALAATGPGYTGLTRRYTVETTADLANPLSWQPVPGHAGIVGANQLVTLDLPLAGAPQFFRLRVTLAP